MRKTRWRLWSLWVLLMPAPVAAQTLDELAAEVRAAETAFAATMVARDLNAFAGFLSEEAVFFTGSVLRGAAAIEAGWAPFFAEDVAPFSWAPERVEVLESGKLALSSGPVLDPDGRTIGTFNSVWRLEPDGRWRVVFDKGCPPCDCVTPGGTP